MIARPKLFLPRRVLARPFSVSRPRREAALPAKKPVGAFRGGYVPILLLMLAPFSVFYTVMYPHILTTRRVFGFLTGAVVAGASVYYYILGDYRVANEMLSDDIGVCLLFTSRLASRCLEANCSMFFLRSFRGEIHHLNRPFNLLP